MFNSWLSRQEVEETEVVLPYENAKRPTAEQINPVDTLKDTWGHFQPFFCGVKIVFGMFFIVAICQIISISDRSRYFKATPWCFPDHDPVMSVPEPHQSRHTALWREKFRRFNMLLFFTGNVLSWHSFLWLCWTAGSSFGNRVKTNMMKQHVIRSNSLTHLSVLVVYIRVCGLAGGMTTSRCLSVMQVKWSQWDDKR